MTRHSSLVGGSTADLRLNCHGSWQAILALPPSVDVESEYAAEGSAMHDVMALLMRNRRQLGFDGAHYYARWLDGLRGQTFRDRVLTQDHIDTLILPALQHLDALEAHYGGGFWVAAVETSCAFPGIPGAFGTVDLVLGSNSHVLHVDWKFGQGVGVKAVYTDALGDRLNPQMMFYTAAFRAVYHALYVRKTMVIAIIQPRGADPLTHTPVSRKDLKWYTEDLQDAVVEALQRDPPRAKGEHCRFAPCKVNCPLWTGPLLDLSSLGHVVQARTDTVSDRPTPYGEYLAKAKQLVDQVELFKKTLDDQLHAYLEDGGLVPGWRLKAKVKKREWINDMGAVADVLEDLGFREVEIWQEKLQTFASVDATAKRLGVKIPDELRVAPPTTETTVCASDDPAPVVERQLAIEQFRASLELLKGGDAA